MQALRDRLNDMPEVKVAIRSHVNSGLRGRALLKAVKQDPTVKSVWLVLLPVILELILTLIKAKQDGQA